MVTVPKKALAVVYLDVFINLVGFGIILPLLPNHISVLATNAGFGSMQGLFNGLTMAAYSIGQAIGSPIFGHISDRFGRRPIWIICLLLQAGFFFLTGFAYDITFLVLTRLGAGVFGGTVSLGIAYITDVTTPKERTTYAGILGAIIGLGFTVGPAIGGIASPLGFAGAMWVAAGLGGLNVIVALLFLQESHPKFRKDLPKIPETETEEENSDGPTSIKYMLNDKNRFLAIATQLLMYTAFSMMESMYGVYGLIHFNMTPETLGFIFMGLGIMLIVVQGGIVRQLAKKVGLKLLLIVGSLIVAASLLSIPFSPILSVLIVITMIMSGGMGLHQPSQQTMLSLIAPEHIRGGFLGLSQGMSALARAIGPMFAGVLFDIVNGLPFWVAAGLTVVCTAMFFGIDSPLLDEVKDKKEEDVEMGVVSGQNEEEKGGEEVESVEMEEKKENKESLAPEAVETA